MKEKIYLVALHKIGIEHKKLFSIFSKKRDYKNFYENLSFKILKKYDFQDAKIEKILENKKELNISELEQKIDKLKVNIITYFDLNYPENLKNIFNPPFLLYVRGFISGPGIAFVGSRAITSYGRNIIENFIPEVGKYFTIISGGAFGCDSYSHQIALKNNIKTVSVIGTGIDINYPANHKKLYDDIVDNFGGIVSIFPFGEPGNPYNFPIRNEIVAGLSVGVVVVEAKSKSGSLITAKLALDLGKEVFAVPGDIFKQNSAGCNNLILSGAAKITLSPNDILTEFNISNDNKTTKTKIIFNDEIEEKIYNLLLLEALNIDEIASKLGLEISFTLLKISILELSNLIRKSEVGKYEII